MDNLCPGCAIQLKNGKLITGKTSELLGASSALLINVLKNLAGIPDGMDLLSRAVIEPIQGLKVKHMGNRNPRLHTDEVLIALSICAATNPMAKLAIKQLPKLRDLEAHSSVILASVDSQTFKKLGVHMTNEPQTQT